MQAVQRQVLLFGGVGLLLLWFVVDAPWYRGVFAYIRPSMLPWTPSDAVSPLPLEILHAVPLAGGPAVAVAVGASMVRLLCGTAALGGLAGALLVAGRIQLGLVGGGSLGGPDVPASTEWGLWATAALLVLISVAVWLPDRGLHRGRATGDT